MKVVVNTPNKGALNLRAEPNGKVLAQIPNGTTLEATIEGDWASTSYKQYKGYVDTRFISISGNGTVTKQELRKIYDSLSATLKLIEEVLK